jgi:cyclopropane fatty-acyl-phospholipid synthase-like methyltransferase
MNDEARFWDKRAEKYAQRPLADQAAYEKKLEITRRYFNPDSVVLEIGCGTGSTALAHAPYVRMRRTSGTSWRPTSPRT